MAEKFEDGEFWLPAEFLDEDFFFKENRPAVQRGDRPSYAADIMMESESEEDYIAGLTRQMAHSFLGDEKVSSALNSKIMGTSPQSTLSDAGAWSASSRGSPNGPSQAPSPPSTPLDQNKGDAWDLLYAAAGQVGRMKRNEQSTTHGRGLLIPPKKPLANAKIPPASAYRSCSPFLTQQQLRVAKFYLFRQFQQLKRDQMIKQHLSAAWGGENRAASNNRSMGVSPFTWPPPQRRQQGSGMRALFLNSSGTRRESAGTGVFLPRRVGTHNDTRKKPACSSVLLPAKVVHALNLNLEETQIYPRYPTYFSFDHDIPSHRENVSSPLQKPQQAPSVTILRLRP
ncbi:hypothetical protein KSP40_PGU017783 [Platanthera guangdongensis]|uniref:Uncharacterized protein n=1 Tax=Platanthera guangdongensis TaxID=2320717 RepID=A0ABR2LZI9_9ASPA